MLELITHPLFLIINAMTYSLILAFCVFGYVNTNYKIFPIVAVVVFIIELIVTISTFTVFFSKPQYPFCLVIGAIFGCILGNLTFNQLKMGE